MKRKRRPEREEKEHRPFAGKRQGPEAGETKTRLPLNTLRVAREKGGKKKLTARSERDAQRVRPLRKSIGGQRRGEYAVPREERSIYACNREREVIGWKRHLGASARKKILTPSEGGRHDQEKRGHCRAGRGEKIFVRGGRGALSAADREYHGPKKVRCVS